MVRIMSAGKRDRRIDFQRAARGRDSVGVLIEGAWASIGQRWAQVRYGSGAERREAAAERATQPATFRTLADGLTRTITQQDRIIYDGLTYDIVGIAPIGMGPTEIEFTAVALRG